MKRKENDHIPNLHEDMFHVNLLGCIFFKTPFAQQKKDVISYNSVLAACAKASCWKQAVAKPGAIDFTKPFFLGVNI